MNNYIKIFAFSHSKKIREYENFVCKVDCIPVYTSITFSADKYQSDLPDLFEFLNSVWYQEIRPIVRPLDTKKGKIKIENR